MEQEREYEELESWKYDRLLSLGNAIVEQAGRDYIQAYLDGDRVELNRLRRYLLSGEVEIITANTTDSEALMEKLDYALQVRYGDFSKYEKVFLEKQKKELEEEKKVVANRYNKFCLIINKNEYVINASIKNDFIKTTTDDTDENIYHKYKKHLELIDKLKHFKIKYKEVIIEKKKKARK